MYKAASANLRSPLGVLSQVRSNSEIKAEKELKRLVSDSPEYGILINNLGLIGLSAVKMLRVIKKGAPPTHVQLSVKEPLKSRDFEEFRADIVGAHNNLKAAAVKLSARAEQDALLNKVNSICAALNEVAEALGIGEG